jgi:hypothetical protein
MVWFKKKEKKLTREEHASLLLKQSIYEGEVMRDSAELVTLAQSEDNANQIISRYALLKENMKESGLTSLPFSLEYDLVLKDTGEVTFAKREI